MVRHVSKGEGRKKRKANMNKKPRQIVEAKNGRLYIQRKEALGEKGKGK